jgi:hypothetical protein
MADDVTGSADGTKWFWYKLDPAQLGVHVGRTEGMTLVWKGCTDINHLGKFFEKAASQVCASPSRHYRVWFMTHDGPKPFNPLPGKITPIPGELISQSGFIQFDCLPTPPASDDDPGNPVFSVFANLDHAASNLEDLQEAVGVYLQSTNLPVLTEDIVEVVSSLRSDYFPPGRSYNPGAVLATLNAVRVDTPILHL